MYIGISSADKRLHQKEDTVLYSIFDTMVPQNRILLNKKNRRLSERPVNLFQDLGFQGFRILMFWCSGF